MDIKMVKNQFEMVKDIETFVITTETVKWLIEQAEKVEQLERVNLIAIHLMTDKQLEKLKQLVGK